MKLIFDGPGRWDSTWYEEIVDGRLRVVQVQKGQIVEADLDDGSHKAAQLRELIRLGTCRAMTIRTKPKE